MSSHQIEVWGRRSIVLAAMVVLVLFHSKIQAQSGFAGRIAAAKWTVLHQFPEPITTVEFLEDQGAPNIGFVGTGVWYGNKGSGSLFRTTDRGNTWSLILTKIPGYVSSVSFKDTLVGWMTTMGGSDTCYGTTDGGQNWKPIRRDYYGSQAYYHASNDLLLLSTWSYDSSLKSTNGGQTWSLLPSNSSLLNGFAFSNDNDGVCGTVSGMFLVTHDGGLTWITSTYFNECWQLAAIRTGRIFIAGSEEDNSFHRTDDAGLTWRAVASPLTVNTSGQRDGLTGCTIATTCALFTQAINGMFVSIDSAKTWLPLHGPVNIVDTRFFARGLEVIAGDTAGKLWMTNINGIPREVYVTANGCDTSRLLIPMDSLWSPGRVVVQLTTDSGGHFQLRSKDTLGTTSKDTLRLSFQSGDFSSHTTTLTIAPIDNPSCLVSQVLVTAQAMLAPLVASSGLVHIGCRPQLAAMHINNRNCEALKITAATASSDLFSVAGLDSLIAGSDSAVLQFSTQAITSSKTYSLRLRGYYVSTLTPFDTTIYIPVTNEHPNSSLVSDAQDFRLPTTATCQSADTTISLTNNGCDTLFVGLGQLGLAPEWTVFPNSDTIRLLPYATDTIYIHFTSKKSGSYTQRLQYFYSGPHSDVTIVNLSETVIPSEPAVSLAATSHDLGERSICLNDTTLEVTLTNSGCDSALISRASIGVGGSFLLLDPSDTILPPGGILQKHVSYHPSKRGPQGQDLSIHFSRLDGSLGHDTTVRFAVDVTRGATILEARSPLIDVGLTYVCEERDTFAVVQNTGCDTLCISNAALLPRGFVIDRWNTTCLAPGAFDTVWLHTQLDSSAGARADSASLAITSDAALSLSPILLTREVRYPVAWSFRLSQPDSSFAMQDVRYQIIQSIASGLQPSDVTGIDITVVYDDDLLQFTTAEEPTVTVTGRTRASDGMAHLTLHISPIPADSLLATIHFTPYLTQHPSSSLQLEGVHLTSRLSRPVECIASTSMASSAFTLREPCTGTLLSEFLHSGSFVIDGLSPNPAQSTVQIYYHDDGPEPIPGTVLLEDAVGRIIAVHPLELEPGKSSTIIQLESIPSGVYLLRISGGGLSASRRLVRE